MSISESVDSDLAAAARRGAAHAYCPYSHFRVGAAVLTDDGRISWGCNVENASYGLTICAERNAIFQAVAQAGGMPVIRAVVIYTPTSEPTAPCGACRQVINEFGPDAEIRCICDGPGELRFRLSALLPAAFGPGNLATPPP
jgi:cytidine deaminase